MHPNPSGGNPATGTQPGTAVTGNVTEKELKLTPASFIENP